MKRSRRAKRSTETAATTAATNAADDQAKSLEQTNSANVQLGLTVLLDAQPHLYSQFQGENASYQTAMNNFYGFRVRFSYEPFKG